jgi:hypothetical protein
MFFDLESRAVAPVDELFRIWCADMGIIALEAIARPERAANFLNGECDGEENQSG